MTPGNNGASTPEDDDPFGYLYEDGQANGATPPGGGGGYGYPGSVNRVRAVGERRNGPQQGGQAAYGQQAPTAQYGQPAAYGQPPAYGQQIPQQQGYGQQNANYAAPETVPGGAPTTRHAPVGDGGGRGRGSNGPNTRGLLIGAIAVVAAVVIGISVAMLSSDSGDDDKGATNEAGPTQSASQSASPSESAGEQPAAELPKADAKVLNLVGATTASAIKGAKADGGVYVTNFNQVGASVTWNVSGIPEEGKYTLYLDYGVPGKDANATLTVNGTAQTRPLNMKNFANAAEGDYEKGWTNTWGNITLNKGTNVIKISCEQGNQCDANLDRVWLEAGWK
ncbi:CBM35 domain-containing protein [Streptomyces sp. NPDC060223]|uniref:CBM35 domain-containing protein n=1 Tax=unclassified Streptomyces TaxID=2593676 RepID=UPI003626EF8E